MFSRIMQSTEPPQNTHKVNSTVHFNMLVFVIFVSLKKTLHELHSLCVVFEVCVWTSHTRDCFSTTLSVFIWNERWKGWSNHNKPYINGKIIYQISDDVYISIWKMYTCSRDTYMFDLCHCNLFCFLPLTKFLNVCLKRTNFYFFNTRVQIKSVLFYFYSSMYLARYLYFH